MHIPKFGENPLTFTRYLPEMKILADGQMTDGQTHEGPT